MLVTVVCVVCGDCGDCGDCCGGWGENSMSYFSLADKNDSWTNRFLAMFFNIVMIVSSVFERGSMSCLAVAVTTRVLVNCLTTATILGPQF